MPKSLMVVLTNPTSPTDSAEFERWYNGKHLPDIAALEGVASATRYRIVGDIPVFEGLPGGNYASLAIYELEAETEEDLRKVKDAMQAAMQKDEVDISPTLDMATAAAYFALPVSERVTP